MSHQEDNIKIILPEEESSTLTDIHRIVVCDDAGIAYCECESGEVTLEENGRYECSQYRLAKFLVSG